MKSVKKIVKNENTIVRKNNDKTHDQSECGDSGVAKRYNLNDALTYIHCGNIVYLIALRFLNF